MKLLYLHVPKTAGSSINKFFSQNIDAHHFHIESIKGLDETFCNKYEFLSGHVPYNRMEEMLNLNEWITFATFREPVAYVISHLKWVRKLADPGEEERFSAHPKEFQTIALKMKEFDFSKSDEITKFIEWLEEIDFYYFHNTQLHYLLATKNQNNLSKLQVEKAIHNLEQINFVGIQEKLDEYMDLLAYEFGWNLAIRPRENINENNYGFDINNPETKQALFRLYDKDIIIYERAKKIFESLLKKYEVADTDVLGYVDRIDKSNTLIGWARYKNSLHKVELMILKDGVEIGRTIANKFRQGLKTKGIHPSGFCQFEFPLNNENIDIQRLTVIPENAIKALPFSM